MSTASPDTLSDPRAPALEKTDPLPVKRGRAKPYVVLGGVLLLAMAAYFLFTWMTRGRENTDDAQIDADVVTVSARVGGSVFKVHVADNQQVRKGDLLV